MGNSVRAEVQCSEVKADVAGALASLTANAALRSLSCRIGLSLAEQATLSKFGTCLETHATDAAEKRRASLDRNGR